MSWVSHGNLGMISALCALPGDVVLMGSGSHVILVDGRNGRILPCIGAGDRWGLHAEKIHGIRRCPPAAHDPTSTPLIIWGVRHCSIWSYRPSSSNLPPKLTVVHDFPVFADCILDAIVIAAAPNDPSPLLVIGHGHAYVQILDSRRAWSTIGTYRCDDQSLLYSLRFDARSNGVIRIASGTVFNEVLLWEIDARGIVDDSIVVLQRLQGHGGVIFSLCWSPCGSMICSTSDDRSIRVWDTARSTCLGIGHGHGSRVWRCAFTDDMVISAGEDGTIRQWSITGQLIDTFVGHEGNIWALAVSPDVPGLCYSGGEDADMRIWRVPRVPPTPRITIDTLSQSLRGLHFISIIHVDDPDRTISVMKSGLVFGIGENDPVQLPCGPSAIARAAALSPDQSRLFVVVDADSGELYSRVMSVPVSGGPINLIEMPSCMAARSLFRIWTYRSPTTSGSFMFTSGNVSSQVIVRAMDGANRFLLNLKAPASALAAFTTDRGTHMVLVGEEKGGLSLFRLDGHGNDDLVEPIFRMARLHGPKMIDYVHMIPSQLDESEVHFVTAGANGMIYRLRMNAEGGMFARIGEYSAPCPRLKQVLSGRDGELYALGCQARTSHLCIWSIATGDLLYQFNTGLARIVHHLQLHDPSDTAFATLRHGTISPLASLVTTRVQSADVIIGRSTRATFHVRQACTIRGVGYPFCCTAGEDGTVRLIRASPDDNSPACLDSVVRGADRNMIRCMAVVPCRQSGGGFIVLTAGAKQTIQALRCTTTPQLELLGHISGAAFGETRRCGKWFNRDPAELLAERLSAIDTRIMSMTALHFDDESLSIVCGTSNGEIQLYDLHPSTGHFTHIQTIDNLHSLHGHHPILSLCSLRLGDQRALIMSADTRGRIVFWQLSKDGLAVITDFTDAHQSGVNCMSYSMQQDRLFVVSGGDDQSIHCLAMTFVQGPTIMIRDIGTCARVSGAHHSCVVALHLTTDAQLLVTGGADRKLRTWRVVGMNDRAKLVQIIPAGDPLTIDVADLTDIDVLIDERRMQQRKLEVVLVGQGFQHLRLSIGTDYSSHNIH